MRGMEIEVPLMSHRQHAFELFISDKQRLSEMAPAGGGQMTGRFISE
jgi:hypothetical protein